MDHDDNPAAAAMQALVQTIETGSQQELPALVEAAATLCQAVMGGDVPQAAASVALMCAVKAKPQLFRDNGSVLPILLDWLRVPEDVRASTAQRSGAYFHRLACNVLLRAFRDCRDWPLAFLEVYMEDALGPRAWVEEHEDAGCRVFLNNIRTCWNPAAITMQGSPMLRGSASSVGGGGGSGPSSVRGTPTTTPSHPPGSASMLPPPPPLALPPPLASSSSASLATPGGGGGGGGSTTYYSDDSDSGDEEVLEEAVVGVFDASSVPSSAAASPSTSFVAPPPSSSSMHIALDGPPEELLPRVYPRYNWCLDSAQQLVLTCVRTRLETGQHQSMWPVIGTLVELAPLASCRRLASEHLQRWLETPAQSKNARTLLTAMVKAVDPMELEDTQLVNTLLELHLPAQQSLLFVESVAVVVRKDPKFLRQTLVCFLKDACITETRPEADKMLALILQQALGPSSSSSSSSSSLPASASATSVHSSRGGDLGGPPASSSWLTKVEVGRELAKALKEQLLARPGPKVQEVLLTVVKTLTLEHIDLLPLMQELLTLPPHVLSTLGPRWEDFLRTVVDSVTALLRYRAQVCLDQGKAWNEQQAKQKRAILSSGAATEEQLQAQKHFEQWRLRLQAMHDLSELHAHIARFSLHVSREILPRLLSSAPVSQQDGLALFCAMTLLNQPPDKNDKSPETFLARYVGVKDSTCRSLVGLTRLIACRPAGGTVAVLEQLEDLVRRAGRIVARREQDHLVAKAVWDGLEGVELRFADPDAAGVVQDVFALARYEPSGELLARRGLTPDKMPALAHADLFWRVALLLLLVSGSNPATVGRWLWHNCPTLRCLMQMVVCNQYHFPPPGAVLAVAGAGGTSSGGRRPDKKSRASLSSSTAPANAAGGLRPEEEQILAADVELAEEEAVLNTLLKGDRSRASKKRKLSLGDGDATAASAKRALTVLSLMFLDLGMPPRRPPPEVLHQLKALDEEFGMGARLRRATEPDFVAAAIAGDGSSSVSRRMLETTMEWLAPAVAAEPDVTMKRLPLECICHMYMISQMELQNQLPQPTTTKREATATAVQLALRKLLEPMRRTILGRLFPEGDDANSPEKVEAAVKALSVFTTELREPRAARRIAARRALDELLSSKKKEKDGEGAVAMDVSGGSGAGGRAGLQVLLTRPAFLKEARQEHCAWVFQLETLACFHANPAPVLRALDEALQVEASHQVISYFLMALFYHCHGPGAATEERFRIRLSKTKGRGFKLSGAFCSPSFFSFVVSSVLSSRKLVIQATMQHVPHLRNLIMEEMQATLDEAAATATEASKRVWQSDQQVRLVLAAGEVVLPNTLLSACLALLSMHKEAELPGALQRILGLLFPPMETKGDQGQARGVQGATKVVDAPAVVAEGAAAPGDQETALSADDWMQLAKCECPAVSAASARCMPAMLLPRLLLCSGLSHLCFHAALSRTEELGKQEPSRSGEVYRKLLSPASTATWGMARAVGTRPALTRKLARRVAAYLKLHAPTDETEKAACTGTFCTWLDKEVKEPTSAAPPLVASEKKASATASSGGGATPLTSTKGLARKPVSESTPAPLSQPPAAPAALPVPPTVTLSAEQDKAVRDVMMPKTQGVSAEESPDDVVERALLASGAALETRSLAVMQRAADLLRSRHVLGPVARWQWTRKRSREGEEERLMEVSYVVQTLHDRVLAAATASPPTDDKDLAGVLHLTASVLCELCQMHWKATDEEGLGARCESLLWDLLLLPPVGATGESSTLRLALLAQVVQTFSVDELEPLVRRIFKEAAKANLAGKLEVDMDVYVALSLLQRWFCRPGQSPMVAELGLLPGTLQGFSASTSAEAAVQPHKSGGTDTYGGGGGPQHPLLLLDGGATSGLTGEAATTVMKLVLQGLALLRNGSSSGVHHAHPHLLFHEAITVLCLRLSRRQPSFLAQLFVQLLASLGTGLPEPPAPVEAHLFHRLYMAFPGDAIRVLRERKVEAALVVRVLRQGEVLLRCPVPTVAEQRMPHDVAQLCRLGVDGNRDNEAVRSLSELVKCHPYLVLRKIHVFAEILVADASPASARPTVSAPFYYPTSAPAPGHGKALAMPPASSAAGGCETVVATFGGGGGGGGGGGTGGVSAGAAAGGSFVAAVELRAPLRIRATFWGLAFRPLLWRAMLDLVMEADVACMAAYVAGQTAKATNRLQEVLAFCALYVKLMAAQQRPPAPAPAPAASTPTPKQTAKQKKLQQQQQQQQEEQFLSPPLSSSANQQPPGEPGGLSADDTVGCLVHMAERLLLLLQELEKQYPQAVLSFLQTPDSSLGKEVTAFSVLKTTLQSQQPPPQQQQPQQQLPTPRKI